MRAKAFTALLVVMTASPALASHGKVGLWEITVKADLSGMFTPAQLAKMRAAGMKMPMANGVTVQHCMTAAEVAMDRPPPEATGQGRECKLKSMQSSSQGFEAEMACSGRMTGTGHMKMSYASAERYSGQFTMNGVMQGHPVKMTSSFDGHWVSASCGKVAH